MTGSFQDRHPLASFAAIASIVAIALLAVMRLVSVGETSPLRGCPIASTAGGLVDLTGGGPDRCPVHGCRLRRAVVPILYGLLRGPFPSKSEAAAFPHGEEWMPGGCCPGVARRALVLQCPECVVARRAWRRSREPVGTDPITIDDVPDFDGLGIDPLPPPRPNETGIRALPGFLLDPCRSEEFGWSSGREPANPTPGRTQIDL